MTLDDWLRAGIREDQMCKEAFLGEFLVPMHASTLKAGTAQECLSTTQKRV